MHSDELIRPSATTLSARFYHAALLFLIAGLLFVVSGCTANEQTAASPEPSASPLSHSIQPAATPEEALADFYNWYTLYPGDPFERRAYRTNDFIRPYLTTSFVQRIDRMSTTLEISEAYDPFVCGEQSASRFEYDRLREDNDSAQVLVRRYYVDRPQSAVMIAKLVYGEGAWQINDINCLRAEPQATAAPPGPPPPIESVEAALSRAALWHTLYYTSPRFHMDYPGTWYTEWSRVSQPFDGDPVDSYLSFTGPGGDEMPVGLVISTGSMESFRLHFPVEAGNSQERVINGYDVLVEEHFDGELYYIIQHPDNAEQRVILRVVTHNEPLDMTVRTAIDRMLATFIFK